MKKFFFYFLIFFLNLSICSQKTSPSSNVILRYINKIINDTNDLGHCIYDSSCYSLIQNVDINDYLMDSYTIDTAFIYGNFLKINISYGGGCEDHIFNLVHEYLFCGTPPVHVPLYLTHNSNNDLCEAALVQELCFDISELNNLCDDSSELFISLNDPENNTFIHF